MSSRSERARLGQETVEILKQGRYTTSKGTPVRIAELMDFAKSNSIHYTPEMFDKVFEKRSAALAGSPRYETQFEVLNCTTLAAARNLIEVYPEVDLYCLNFASAKNPGGGFLKGSRAQEESLAMATGLYPCINQMQKAYQAGRECGTCLYTNNMIYSPKVPVIRDDDGNLLEEPYTISVITSAAVNAGHVKAKEQNQIEPTMLARMERVLSLAIVHEHHTLVLGAWGCGVFKNGPADMARWFHSFLVESPTFQRVFQRVVFAILDSSTAKGFIGPFEKLFGVRSAL